MTKFKRAVYRETDHATVVSRGARPIIVGLIDGDLIELRLKGERRRVFVAASTVFYHALALDVARVKREKAKVKKEKAK